MPELIFKVISKSCCLQVKDEKGSWSTLKKVEGPDLECLKQSFVLGFLTTDGCRVDIEGSNKEVEVSILDATMGQAFKIKNPRFQIIEKSNLTFNLKISYEETCC